MRTVLLLAMGLGAACGSDTSQVPVVFSTQASHTVTSESGALSLAIFEPVGRPMARGVNALQVLITSDAGVRFDGLSMRMTTWMPAMGHGSSVIPSVAAIDGGFVATNISLPMAGQWDLRCTFEGPLTDHATLSYDIQ